MMFAKDSFADIIRLNKLALQFFGIIPLNGRLTTCKQRFSNFLTLLTLCCISGIIIPVLHFLVSANLDLDQALDVLNVVAGVLGGEFRMILVALNRKKIQHLFATCEALWLDASPLDCRIISIWTNRGKLLSFVLCSATVLAVLLYLLLPVFEQISSDANIRMRSWPYQIKMDPTQSPRYEIYYVVQSAAACVAICSICGCDLIGPVVALHACGQLRLIQAWLMNVASERKRSGQLCIDGHSEEQIKKCIRRHQIVMELCAKLEEVVCYVNFAQALGAMYMMAISAARLTKMKSTGIYKPLGPLFLAIGQLFVSCWPADNLSNESTNVAKALYEFPWYRCPPRMREAIVLMIARSQRAACLTAGKFVTFSLETFSSIISTAISVAMLLQSFDSAT